MLHGTVTVIAVDALVIGAGVIGLTTAISLAEAGLKTTVRAAGTGAQTTSFAAGALWGPVRCGPPKRTLGWSRTGLEVMTELAHDPASGIRMVAGQEVSRTPAQPPPWVAMLHGGAQPARLPEGYASGWRYYAPLANMPVYLGYLRDRFRKAGGVIEYGQVTSLRDLTDAPVLVNCTGTGARGLVPDPLLRAVRGQVVIVTNPGVEEFHIEHSDTADYVYYFPHGDVVLLGGTAQDDAWDLSVHSPTTSRILADCRSACPALRGAQVVGLRVGLRPWREQVRLDREELPSGRVLWHNYGHGGGGVTLAWGCAREITESVTKA
jgi:D-amino-acid oxidase